MEGIAGRTPQGTAAPGTQGSAALFNAAKRPGLPASVLPGLGCAIAFAVSATAVEALISHFTGSYVAFEIVLAAALVWAAAGAAVWLALTLASAPLIFLLKGPMRRAIVPALVIAAGSVACALGRRTNFIGADIFGGAVFFNTYFLAIWGLVVGWLAAAVVTKDAKGRVWPGAALAIGAVVFTSALAYFIWDSGKGLTLVVGPLALIATGGAVMDKVRRPKAPAVVAVVSCALFAATLVAIDYTAGRRPLAPIDSHFTSDGALAAAAAGKPNVIIITLDTTRADHMSLCGYGYPTTPGLVKLAADCQFFPNGATVDAWTLPAHASLFTGKFPREHGAHGDATTKSESLEGSELYGIPLAPSQLTLATYLGRKGYNTAGFVANYSWLCRQFGFDQGFAYYYDLPRFLSFMRNGSALLEYGAEAADRVLGRNGKFVESTWDASTVTRFAGRWVRENKSTPFFLFLNYMDPHAPYAPPPPFDSIDGPGIPFSRIASHHEAWSKVRDRYINDGEWPSDEFARSMVNQYDGEIAYADYWVSKLVETLKAEGVYDDTLLIITCDHGEFLGEHQLLSHGTFLYEGGVRTPILVKLPRREHAGETITSRVSILDIFATVFDVLKLPMPKVTAQPLDRVTHLVIAEDPEKGGNVMRYGDRFRRGLAAIYDGDMKYIQSTKGNDELYDLAADPAETRNLLTERGDVVRDMSLKLAEWREKTPEFDGKKEMNARISPEMEERLKSLGYTGGRREQQ